MMPYNHKSLTLNNTLYKIKREFPEISLEAINFGNSIINIIRFEQGFVTYEFIFEIDDKLSKSSMWLIDPFNNTLGVKGVELEDISNVLFDLGAKLTCTKSTYKQPP